LNNKMNRFKMTCREFGFIGLAALFLIASVIGISHMMPANTQEEIVYRSEKSKRMKGGFGYPDLYADFFKQAEGLDVGYEPYPQGYKMIEFQKAMLANAKRGATAKLDWIERGPGRVGGRTRAVLVDPRDPEFNTFYVGSVGGGVWKARRYIDELGHERIEWTPLTDHLPSLAVSAMAGASPNHPEVIYVGTGEGFFNSDASSGVGMFKTIDGGQSWIHLTSTTNNDLWRYINRIAVDPNNQDNVVAATDQAIFRSEDGGLSWTRVFSGYIQDLRAKPDDFNVQFATQNSIGILRSIDGGRTWQYSIRLHQIERIEIAISQSHPDVIWASVAGNPHFSGFDRMYRSTDMGEFWQEVEPINPGHNFFLHGQGWYDNAITVHPFSPDTVYLGGVFRYEAWIEGDSEEVGTVGRFSENTSFLSFVRFVGRGGLFHSAVELGIYEPLATDIDLSEMTSVEIRFGPNLTQFAHRFSVPPTGGTNEDGGAGISFSDYRFEDYVEVPFQVWDTDNNRQLSVSFRDQANDGKWNLITRKTDGPGKEQSREYVFISKHDYNASAPLSDYMTNGGFTSGLMYYVWPTLREGDGIKFDPDSLDPGTVTISFVLAKDEDRDMALWEDWEVHVDHHHFTVIPIDENSNEFHILNGNDGGFAYSRNSGKTWIEGDAFPGFNTSQFYDATKRPGFPMYLGGTQDNGNWVSYNNANSRRGWRYIGPLADGFDVVWKGNDSLIFSTQFNDIYRSLDGGANWAESGNIADFEGQFMTSIGWTPESGDAVFSISPDPAVGLLRSLDFGDSWNAIKPSEPDAWLSNRSTGRVRVSLADPSVVWAGYRLRSTNGRGRLFVSENALNPFPGEHVQDPVKFRPVNSPSFAPRSILTGLATHPFSRATAYVTFSVSCQPKLLRTEDMGQTWKDLSGFAETEGCQSSNGFPNAKVWDVEVFPEVPRIIWAGTDMGIFESRDHGQTWAYADNGLPAVSVWRIRIVDGEVVLATHGRGVWSLDINQVQTSLENVLADVPTSFELLDNYPNPFNPSTTIGFKLATDSHIQVSVFDVLGRKVATLTDQPYSSGTHEITWDASAVSSGQYIYRMEADGKLIGAKSMVLVK